MAGVDVPSKPINRKEQYLAKIAGQSTEIPAYPITREEAYLNEIAKSSGGGGTTDYEDLENKPQIGGVELSGNKSLADLGIASAQSVSEIKDGQEINSFAGVENALTDKTDDDAVAPEFDNTVAYNAGNLVYHDGTLYKFDSDHAAGAWDASEVSPTTVAAEFNQLKNTLSIHMVSGTTPAQLVTAFNKLTTLQKNTSKIYVLATDGSGGVLPCIYSKHYEIMYFDSNTISDIQLDISNSSATLIKAVYTFGSSTRTNTTLTIDNWTIYYFGDPIS